MAMNIREPILEKMAAVIRNSVRPERIILFGSRAKGEYRAQSDYDILIVAPSSLPRWKRTVPIYRLLAGMGCPKDIVWLTPEEIEEWKGVQSHFITTIVREGKVLYEKSA